MACKNFGVCFPCSRRASGMVDESLALQRVLTR